MGPTNTRRVYDTDRIKKNRPKGRRWLALALMALSIAAAAVILSRDMDWEKRSREARYLGLIAESNGNYETARAHYETALANHPYDWATHLSLARILNYRLNDYANALRHYLFALGYSPQMAIAQEVNPEIELLKMVFRGELENPGHALEDMFRAIEEGTEELFYLRLSPRLRDSLPDYWRGWTERGRGKLVFCRMRDENNGFFDAHVSLVYPDETVMSMHMYCVKGQVWRLELGFP